MIFDSESVFEDNVITVIKQHGWKDGVLRYPTEQDLLDNWKGILYRNNNDIDRLGKYPLTDGEMAQIIEQIETLRTPLALNSFVNGRTVSITRDNKEDVAHFGKEISLYIYDRKEIAGGKSTYQIAQQPVYPAKNKMLNSRRGDLVLLINGMPLIHIELKKSGIPVSQATNQIEKYTHEGVFTGLFRLVQIFVAMNPDDAVYFANPGVDKFNPSYYFHWADYNNEPICGGQNPGKDEWKLFIGGTSGTAGLLSIPMAHQLIGFYTIADSADGCLKVLRSYQYIAANAISDVVRKCDWEQRPTTPGRPGGYVWHTTGSGKTMTSFKSAQLIADSHDADKVVFLMDRIELGTQSLKEYRSFADSETEVQGTENTGVLRDKLNSTNVNDTLIVTSIQKMSNVKAGERGVTQAWLDQLAARRIVFIVDECHRSTFGDMLQDIRRSFPNALFFGFTGTPILDENQKKNSTTAMVFGRCLHRYSIADGIRDHNVLGFDPYMVTTYKDSEVRRAVALDKAKAESAEDALADSVKAKVFQHYMDKSEVPMGPMVDGAGNRISGIEDFLGRDQYGIDSPHPSMVVSDILEQFPVLSHAGKFHAMLAASSIPEAVNYYHLFKQQAPKLHVTALFDPNIDNNEGATDKEDALTEIITDYNEAFGKEFVIPTWPAMKKDISSRLSHKSPYGGIATNRSQQLDLLIVVDQMLTGFDSKWVNTLYLDKIIDYESIIQAFSRTNRLFGPDKPFGVIRYYRKPHTMHGFIEAAVKLYSGDRPLDLFVQKLPANVKSMDTRYREILDVFSDNGELNPGQPNPKALLPLGLRGLTGIPCPHFAHILQQHRVHGLAHRVQIIVEQVGVHVQCHRGGSVAELALHGLDVRAGFDHETRGGMPQIMHGHLALDARAPLRPVKPRACRVGPMRATQVAAARSLEEDIVGLAALAQRPHVIVQHCRIHDLTPLVRLRSVDHYLTLHLGGVPAYPQPAASQINVPDLQTHELSPAYAGQAQDQHNEFAPARRFRQA